MDGTPRLAQILRPSGALRTAAESLWPPGTEGFFFLVCEKWVVFHQ